MIYTAILSVRKYEGTYFDALELAQVMAPELFELCDDHAAELVTTEIEFLLDEKNGTKDLRAVLHYDESDEPNFEHEEVPENPTAPATETDTSNAIFSLPGNETLVITAFVY